MLTISIPGLIFIVFGASLLGCVLGFFTAALLAVGKRDDEQWDWPGEVKR